MRGNSFLLVPTLCDPMDCSLPVAPLSMAFSRKEHLSGLPCSPPGDLPNAGIESASLVFPALAGRFFTTGATWEAQVSGCLNKMKEGRRGAKGEREGKGKKK